MPSRRPSPSQESPSPSRTLAAVVTDSKESPSPSRTLAAIVTDSKDGSFTLSSKSLWTETSAKDPKTKNNKKKKSKTVHEASPEKVVPVTAKSDKKKRSNKEHDEKKQKDGERDEDKAKRKKSKQSRKSVSPLPTQNKKAKRLAFVAPLASAAKEPVADDSAEEADGPVAESGDIKLHKKRSKKSGRAHDSSSGKDTKKGNKRNDGNLKKNNKANRDRNKSPPALKQRARHHAGKKDKVRKGRKGRRSPSVASESSSEDTKAAEKNKKETARSRKKTARSRSRKKHRHSRPAKRKRRSGSRHRAKTSHGGKRRRRSRRRSSSRMDERRCSSRKPRDSTAADKPRNPAVMTWEVAKQGGPHMAMMWLHQQQEAAFGRDATPASSSAAAAPMPPPQGAHPHFPSGASVAPVMAPPGMMPPPGMIPIHPGMMHPMGPPGLMPPPAGLPGMPGMYAGIHGMYAGLAPGQAAYGMLGMPHGMPGIAAGMQPGMQYSGMGGGVEQLHGGGNASTSVFKDGSDSSGSNDSSSDNSESTDNEEAPSDITEPAGHNATVGPVEPESPDSSEQEDAAAAAAALAASALVAEGISVGSDAADGAPIPFAAPFVEPTQAAVTAHVADRRNDSDDSSTSGSSSSASEPGVGVAAGEGSRDIAASSAAGALSSAQSATQADEAGLPATVPGQSGSASPRRACPAATTSSDGDIFDGGAAAMALLGSEAAGDVLLHGIRLPSTQDLLQAAAAASETAGPCSAEVEVFLQNNIVDPEAAVRLRSLAPPLQRRVLDRGELRHTRNPSAVLIARVRDAEGGVSSQDGLGQPAPPPVGVEVHAGVEGLIVRYGLDARAAGVLRALPKHKQDDAATIDLSDARRPSAFIMAQLTHAKYLDGMISGLVPTVLGTTDAVA